MKIAAQVHKFLFISDAGQSQFLCTVTEPLAGNALAFHVVITNAKMFAKIRFRISQTVLSLHRQHGGTLNHVGCNYAPSVAQNGWPEMLPVNRIGNGRVRTRRCRRALP